MADAEPDQQMDSARSPEPRQGSEERTREPETPIESSEKQESRQELRNKRFGPPSPTEQQERRSKRRRSNSPVRRDNDIYRQDYRRDEALPRRGRGGHGPRDDVRDSGHFNPAFRNGPPRPPAPEEVPYLVSFRHFSDFHRDIRSPISESRDALDAAYLKYRNDFTARQLSLFFEEHRARAWFRERYDPSLEDLRQRVKAQGREGKVDKFLTSIGANVLSDLSYDLAAPTSAPAADTDEAEINGDSKMDEDKVEEPTEDGAEKSEKVDPSLPNKPEAERKTEFKEDEFVLIAPAVNQLFIKSLSPDIERTLLEQHCAQVEGYGYLAISEPNHMRRYQRVGWISFQPGTDMDAALSQLGESKIHVAENEQFTLHMHQSIKPTYQKLRVAPGLSNDRERLEKDLQQASLLVQRLEAELGDTRGSVAIAAHFSSLREAAQAAMTELPEESKVSIMSGIVKRELDATLYYLRNVFNTCYYCTCICDYPEELLQRCAKHVRRPLGSEAPRPKGGDPKKRFKPNDQAYMRRLDERLSLLITPEEVDPREHGGKSTAEELHRLCLPHIKVEDESKFRCQVDGCGKAFKAANFAEKHISNKHQELIASQLLRVRYFNNYVLDPDRILPPAPDGPLPGAGHGDRFNGPPISFSAGSGFGPHSNGDFGPPQGPYRGRGPRGPRGGGPRYDRPRREINEARERLIDTLPPPAPPKGVQLDPRAQRQRSTYEDLDSAGPPSGELELEY